MLIVWIWHWAAASDPAQLNRSGTGPLLVTARYAAAELAPLGVARAHGSAMWIGPTSYSPARAPAPKRSITPRAVTMANPARMERPQFWCTRLIIDVSETAHRSYSAHRSSSAQFEPGQAPTGTWPNRKAMEIGQNVAR